MPEQKLPRIPGDSRGRIIRPQMGRSQDTVLAVNPGSIQLIEWSEDDLKARWMTAQISNPRPVNIVPGLDPYRINATWGTAGTHHICEMDVENGTTFSVWASYLRVVLVLDPLLVTVTSEASQVRGTLGLGAHPGSRLPQRTLVFGELLAAASTTTDFLPIPFFADSLIVMRDPVAQQFRVHVQDGTGADIYEVDVGASAMCPLIPLSNDARFVEIENTSTGTINSLRLIFGLVI